MQDASTTTRTIRRGARRRRKSGEGNGRRLTMKQIGEMVGVSQSTISRVLSGTPMTVPVSPETRERILKVVADVGYTPNPLARALRSARTALLGLIVRDIADPFFATAIADITAEARRAGYSVVLGHVRSSGHQAVQLSEVLEMGHTDGTILLGDLRDQATLWSHLARSDMPLVGLWQGSRAPHIPVVNVDNRAGIHLALDHLVSLGHQRIAFLQGGRTGDGVERRNAYLGYMREHHLPVPDGYVQASANDFASTSAMLPTLLALPDRPTAVLASTDVAAIGALKGASLAGVPVPQELSVAGFDDIPLAEFTIPALTTVRQPMKEIARLAVKQLRALIEQPDKTPRRRQVITPSLVVRDSTARPFAERGEAVAVPEPGAGDKQSRVLR